MPNLNENSVEQFAINLLQSLGWGYVFGPDIAPDGKKPKSRYRMGIDNELNAHIIKQMREKKKIELKAIDFFSSGGGMSCGMKEAGIRVLAGIDIDPKVKDTYEKNIGAKFILKDICELKESELSVLTGIEKNDDNLIMIGCSPCQYWSIIRTNKEKSLKSKDLLREFHRFVKYYNPGFVVVENVPGLEKKAKESGLNEFVNDLKKRGYTVNYRIYDLNEYGVPQTRKRFSLIASRVVKNKIEPEKSEVRPTVRDAIGDPEKFPPVEAGFRDYDKRRFHSCAKLNGENLEAIKKTKPGGRPAKKRKKFKGKGFSDNYGRMEWDKPAPTITTKFISFSNGRFGHPEQNRALSVREGAALQTFPDTFEFVTNSIIVAARIIGDAVPPEFAKRIGKAIIKALENET